MKHSQRIMPLVAACATLLATGCAGSALKSTPTPTAKSPSPHSSTPTSPAGSTTTGRCVWAVSASVIRATTNGGAQWHESAALWSTTDGGRTWRELLGPASESFDEVVASRPT